MADPEGLAPSGYAVLVSRRADASRNRLARELHDAVGQSITAMLMEIRVAIDRGQAGREDLRILEREAEKTLETVRTLAYRLRQHRVPDPLAEARRYGERLLATTGGISRWIDERTSPGLAPSVARQLAWSIRESITNAVRHGDAALVEVRIRQSGGRINVTIRDDGAGFQVDDVRPSADGRGLGLLGNAERMAQIGGIFSIRSRPGEGTVVLLDVPITTSRGIIPLKEG